MGVFIQVQYNQHIQQLHVSAVSPSASSPLQAETFGLMLATRLAEILKIQDPHFTDCSMLASAAKAIDIFSSPGHWDNRPLIQKSPPTNKLCCDHILAPRMLSFLTSQLRIMFRYKLFPMGSGSPLGTSAQKYELETIILDGLEKLTRLSISLKRTPSIEKLTVFQNMTVKSIPWYHTFVR
jgi:hypothetical protein